jgi:hypothetical protein
MKGANIMYNEKFDWETREDADILKRYQDIKADPARLAKAQACIQDNINQSKKALGVKTSSVPGRKNPATIMKMKIQY